MNPRHIPALVTAVNAMADTFGQIDDASPFRSLTCSELDSVATVLAVAGHRSRAASIIALHAYGDFEPGDGHGRICDLLGDPGLTASPALVKALGEYVDALLNNATDRPHLPETPRPVDGAFSVQTDHVDYVKTRATEWLNARFSALASADYTNADAQGIDEHWPGTGSDDRLSAVADLIGEALDADVIRVDSQWIDDARLIQTRSHDGVITGARMFVETPSGVTLASAGPLWADDFVAEHTGRAAAYAALAHAAKVIDHLLTGHRAARGL